MSIFQDLNAAQVTFLIIAGLVLLGATIGVVVCTRDER